MLAKRKFQEAEATLGPFHPDLTENLEALAKIYESYGETRKAKRCYARILKIWEKVLAPDYGLKCFLADILGIPLSKQHPKIFYKPQRIIHLNENLLLGIGENRICFIHPDDPGLCIKIDRPWDEGRYNTRRKRIKRVFMPWLADFSSNREEARFYWKKARRLGEIFYLYAPRCYGIVTTNLGPGLVFERIFNDDGTKSLRLGLHLKRHPEDAEHVLELLKELYQHLTETGLLFYSWSSPNFVVQKRKAGDRIVIIDWKSESRPNMDFPAIHLFRSLAQRKMEEKFLGFLERYLGPIIGPMGSTITKPLNER